MKTKKSILYVLIFNLILPPVYSLTNVVGLPEGFVTLNGGVTGGEGGTVLTVTNQEELIEAIDGFGNEACIVLVKDTITVNGELSGRGNKTIVGLGTDACIMGGGFGFNTKSNVIIQNINFEDAPDDLIKINNKCTNFWIDHCTFSDGANTNEHDGMLDITRGTQYVTVSYCHFFNHDKNILIGHSDSETGDTAIRVTLHHNWFNGTIQRNPRVRYATVHCYNNYHVSNTTYGIASACDAYVLVENCYFKDTEIPLQVGVPEYSPAGYLNQNGCYFSNCGTPQTNYVDMTGRFPYTYQLDSVETVPSLAEMYMGSGKDYRTLSLLPEVSVPDLTLRWDGRTITFASPVTNPAKLTLYSSDGRLLGVPFHGWIEANELNQVQLDISQLKKGCYLIRLETPVTSSQVKQILPK